MAKKCILIVEDEFLIAFEIEQTLKRLGYLSGGIANSYSQTIKLIKKRTPDLILMDIKIQGEKDGIEVAKIVREQYEIPILFLTSYADNTMVKRAESAGAFGYLIKPFDDRILNSNIKIALYKFNMERELAESEARYRGILHQSIEPIILFDPSSRKILEANRAFCQLIGVPMNEARTLMLFDFIDGDIQDVNRFIKDIMVSSEGRTSNAYWKKKNGQHIEVEMSSTKVGLKGKDIISIMARDVTVVKRIERIKEEERQAHFSAIVEAQEDERNRIAVELHDSLGQMLSAISYKIENTLLSEKGIANNKKLLKSIHNVQDILDNAIQEVRNISQDLMPMILRDFGLGPALRSLCVQAKETGKLNISFRNHIKNLRINNKVERMVYRIAQEAINNVLKHSKAKKSFVSLSSVDGRLLLKILDDGVGYDILAKRKRKGMGLMNMEERTRSLNGSLKYISKIGEGTQVLMSFELPPRKAINKQ